MEDRSRFSFCEYTHLIAKKITLKYLMSKKSKKSELFLEPVCYKKRQKSPKHEIGLGSRGTLEALIDTKLILNEHE